MDRMTVGADPRIRPHAMVCPSVRYITECNVLPNAPCGRIRRSAPTVPVEMMERHIVPP